jgi:hypothetical protein
MGMRKDLIGNTYAKGKHWTLPKKGKIINCIVCGKEKYYCLSAIKRGGGKYCSSNCTSLANKGKKRLPFSDAHKLKISENHYNVSGDKNPNWQGGISDEMTRWHNNNWKKLKQWRDGIFKRDGYKCKDCGETENLEAHHIVPLGETLLTAFLPMNGVCLCKPCHKKTDNYAGKKRYKNKLESGIGKVKSIIVTIPHNWQEYKTCGNYKWIDNLLIVFVSETGNEDYNILITLHEFLEAYISSKRGVKESDIMEFDIAHLDSDEPGSLLDAPYYKEHQFAEGIERIMCNEMDIPWHTYSEVIDGLFKKAYPEGA